MAENKLEKLALEKQEKELIKQAQLAAHKRGVSVFDWLKMSGFDFKKKPSKKLDSPKIIELAPKKVIIEAPKASAPAVIAPKEFKPEEEQKRVEISSPKGGARHFVLETELRNPILRTEFDRVLKIIEDEGTISSGVIKSKLGIDSVALKECYQMLQKAGKIRVEYPLFGPPMLISTEYERAKKRRARAKKGILPDMNEEDED